jgi:mRNA-degrading endonuclease RelE of RelBE toxin-antitoxin system
MRIFDGVLRFVRTGRGDVQEIKGDAAGRYRLRVGDYRAFFTYVVGGVRIDRVKHRSEAYR